MKRNRSLSFILILSGFMLLSACKKENKNVGIDIQPPGDNIGLVYTDTISVNAYSRRVDSLRTDETSSSLMGSIYDPIFGITTANLFTQFSLSETAVTFGDNPEFDSLILTLDYKGIYGDTNAVLTLDVYELAEKFYVDSSYFSNDEMSYYPTLIASKTFTPNLKDSVILGTDTLKPHFRINLSKTNPDLAQKLIEASPDHLDTQDDFQDYFYGLYLKIHDVYNGGAITYFNLQSSYSRMILYFHNQDEDSLYFSFVINSATAYFGQYLHNYSVAQPIFRDQVINGDTSLGRTTCYIQAMAGVMTAIKFPYLRNLVQDGKIAVNEAKLLITLQEENPTMTPASSMALVKSDGQGGYNLLTDQLQGTAFFGGSYDSLINGYWFRITGTIQQILSSEDPDYGFELYISGGSIIANRSILNGYNPDPPVPQEDRLRLVLTYTKAY